MRRIIFLSFLLIQLQFYLRSQNALSGSYVTPGGIMDTVFDRFGKKYAVLDLQVNNNNSQGLLPTPTQSCIAGMFAVYYANGSGMESPTNPLHILRRQTVCEVLSNVSGLLGYTSSYPNSALVRILVDDVSSFTAPTSPSVSGVLGLATAFYVVPWNPASSHPGSVENLVQKTIKSKTDAWTNLLSPIAPVSSNGLFHGMMAFNFANPNISWNSGYSSVATSTQFDLYTVILHEITHALGFASLINGNGISKFGATNNYYSLFDKFLNRKVSNAFVPLLVPTNSCNTNYALTFTMNPNVLAPGCTTNYLQDATTCSTAILYNSALVPNMPVYTPSCFEASSSLSHFEDMCYPTNTPSNNNQYFTMSNANGPGTNKRFLKQEEKNVLCDLGYAVINSYTSNAVSASCTYTGGTCNPSPVWGVNDGFSNSNYLYTSTGGPVTIPITGIGGIIANDYQGSSPVTTVSCVESVYNNGTAIVSGANIIFSPSNSNGGLFLIRYIPKNSFGIEGNITYIFGFVYPSFCGSVTPCDMVQNGGFENNSGCGSMPVGTSTLASCWLVGSLSPDIFVRGCLQSNPPANLGTNTYSSNIVFDSFNGSPNNSVAGIGAYTQNNDLYGSESLANYLGSPILNNQAYTLSFWAYQFQGAKYDPEVSNGPANFYIQSFNTYSISAVLSFATNSIYIPAPLSIFNYPYTSLNTIKSVTLSNVFNTWLHYSFTFTATNAVAGKWLYVGMDKNQTVMNIVNAIGTNSVNEQMFYTLLDNISLRPANQAPQLNIPLQICTGQSLSNLGQYVNVIGGNFSGNGITSSVVSTSNGTVTQYNFNASQTMPNGLYTITFTYTDNIHCSQTAIQQISIGNVINGLNIAYASTTNCVNAGTLSVISPTPSYNYTWQPGNFIGNTYTINSNALTTYTVLASNGTTCYIGGSLRVWPNNLIAQLFTYPQPGCKGDIINISAIGNYTSILWQPGNYTTSAVTTTLLASTNYSASVTNSLGCTANLTTTIVIAAPPVLNISVSSLSVCSGQTATLTASGALLYFWDNGPTTFTNLINPTTATIYTVTGVDGNNCSNTATLLVSIFTPSIAIKGSTVICAGESVTLAAQSGANTYAWFPANAYTQIIYVSPATTTNYTVSTTTYSNGSICNAKNTVQIVVNPCTDIKEVNNNAKNFKIFPNPNDGTFQLESIENSDLEIKIYNDLGLLVKLLTLTTRNDHKLIVDDLSSGIYFVEAGGMYTKLIISK